ncbi:unnamed protein product [Effrenium voratum]|nr:unnamed protein product [Effrenium voratum]
MLVFNPLPELNATISLGKQRMLQTYLHLAESNARQRVFASLSGYSEHLVPLEHFQRPPALGVYFWQGIGEDLGNHFAYDWTRPLKAWGEPFTAKQCGPAVQEFFINTWRRSCEEKTTTPIRFPEICLALQRHSASLGAELWRRLQAMEAWVELQASTPRGPAGLRCQAALPSAEVKGSVTAWDVELEASREMHLEMLVLRPIIVGWKEGYKGRTYKIQGSSGPRRVKPGFSQVSWQPAAPIPVQPYDEVGWGAFVEIGNLSAYPADPKREAACVGARGCEGDICVFDTWPEEWMAGFQMHKASMRTARAAPPARAQKFFQVMEALDISEFVESSSSYEELLTLRHRLEHPDLGLFEDKIRLRRELLPAAGVEATPSIHLSYDDFDVARFLHGRSSYVVKPSHMSESQHVFVIKDGLNLLHSTWFASPARNSVQEIQAVVDGFPQHKAKDWECRALLGARPGVIVEELVLATKAELPGKYMVDEYKFYTSWGETILAENIIFSSGVMMEISRDGQILTAKDGCPPACLAPCFREMVRMADQVATYARTDFLRVDILVQGNCEALYVSEVELFPASDFSPALKEAVAQRWRSGYGGGGLGGIGVGGLRALRREGHGANGETAGKGRCINQPEHRWRLSCISTGLAQTKVRAEASAAIKKVSSAGDDYYRILGVDKGATDDEIKKAYRRLALRLHPDKCQEPGAEEAFKQVGEAFSVLSDADKRQKYDRFGVDALRGGGGGGADFSPEDLFEAFFAGANGGMPGMGRTFTRAGPGTFVFTSGPGGGFSFGGGAGMRQRRPRQQEEEEPSEVPSWAAPLQAFAAALGPMLPLVLILAFFFFITVVSVLVQVLMTRMIYILPVVYLTEGKTRTFLLISVIAAAMVGIL